MTSSSFDSYLKSPPLSPESNSINDRLSKGYDLDQSVLTKYSNSEHSNVAKAAKAAKVLPPCHLTFDALGVGLDLFDMAPAGLNLKLFKKIDTLGDNIKKVNNTLIELIKTLNCCNIADSYNENVVPLFEYVLDGFVTELVKAAEKFLQEYQRVSIVLCAIRPVPGNPWMKGGAYDWINTLYSIIDGFNEIFKWIVNGNILDIILDPLKSFNQKLSSCSPLFESTDDNVLKKAYITKTAQLIAPQQSKSKAMCNCLFSIAPIFDFGTTEDYILTDTLSIKNVYSRVMEVDKDDYKEALSKVDDDEIDSLDLFADMNELTKILISDDNYQEKICDLPYDYNFSKLYNLKKYNVFEASWSENIIEVELMTLRFDENDSDKYKMYNIDNSSYTDGTPNLFDDDTPPDLGEPYLYHSGDESLVRMSDAFELNDNRYKEIQKIRKHIHDLQPKLIKVRLLLEKTYNEYREQMINNINASFLYGGSSVGTSGMGAKEDLNSMGMSFNIYKFISYVKNNGIFHEGVDLYGAIYTFEQVQNSIDVYKAAENRLHLMREVDHCQIKLVGKPVTFCDCNIICKLIQMLIDLILNAINDVIKIMIKNLINVLMNEKVSYIIKIIIDKYQCILNYTVLGDNKKKIEETAKFLKEKYEKKDHGLKDSSGESIESVKGVRRMEDINCDAPDNKKSAEIPTLYEDPNDVVIGLDGLPVENEQTQSNPIDEDDTEAGDRPNVIFEGTKIVEAATSNANIPTMKLTCPILSENEMTLDEDEILPIPGIQIDDYALYLKRLEK